MKAFCELFIALDESNRTSDKVAVMRDYFQKAAPASAAWALFFLSGKRLPAFVKTKDLRAWAAQLSGLPDWLVEESYAQVGDLAETVALILPDAAEPHLSELPLSDFVETHLLPLRDWDGLVQFQLVRDVWAGLDSRARFVFNKLITGAFRVGVSRKLVTRALAEMAGIEAAVMEHRLMGDWQPSAEAFKRLLDTDDGIRDPAQPYPFYLASPLEQEPEVLGPIADWQAEWKWDGIRAQLIRRAGHVILWSRGEDIVSERFPEITQAAARLPVGTVLDGEILCWHDGKPLPFNILQTRIGRKQVTAKVLEEAPAVLLVYDCLEADGQDARQLPLSRRRELLEMLFPNPEEPILLGTALEAGGWDKLAELRQESRQRGVEGLMLKRKDSPYLTGRVRGDWWKWKIDPYSIDAVMLYAQVGHGRRAGLFTDYTFGVWEGDALVTVAKAYSGLTKEEIQELDTWVKAHTLSRKGPVRMVEPELVFELHFEGLAESARHRSGLAVRFPRIARWRRDKQARDADTIQSLRALLNAPQA